MDPGAALTAYQPSWGHTQDDRFRPVADLTAAGPKRSAACRRRGRSQRGRRPRAFLAHIAPQWSAAATSDRRSSLRRSQSRRASRLQKTSNRGSSRMSRKTTACPCRQGRSGDLRSCRPVRRGSKPTDRRERPCAACSCRSRKGRCSSARLQPRPGMRHRHTSTFGPSLPPKLAPRSGSVTRPTSAYPRVWHDPPLRAHNYRQHEIATLFGQVTVRLPRFCCAECDTTEAGADWPPRVRSPPELNQLRAQLSALLTYRTAADLSRGLEKSSR